MIKKSGKVTKKLLEDDHFGSLFNNPDYQINEDDINFKLHNLSGVKATQIKVDDDMDSDAEDSNNGDDDGYVDGDDDGYVDGDAFKSKFQRVDSDGEES
jgi:hypothetical protein